MKKALITGIAGQDGSYLSELLLEKGDVKLIMATLVVLLDMKYITEPKMINKKK